jgi:hypothetical protein
MPLLKQNVQNRCIICDVTQFSGIGGSGRIRTYLCLQMTLFQSSRIYRDTLKDRPFGPIIIALKFKVTIHAPCLYHGTFNNDFILFLRIVDDFSIACALEETYILLCDKLDLNWQVPMSRYGMMKHFNVIDISQSTTPISISSKTYLGTVFKNYEWDDIVPTSLPMNPSTEFVRALDLAIPLETAQSSKTENSRFYYRATSGELIWPMITTQHELSYPMVNLS